MTDLNQLERDLLTQVDAAGDEAALETVRVSALGKKGSVSELLKTLGSMTPEERKERGPLINGSFSQNAFVAQAVASGIGSPNASLVTVVRRLPNYQQIHIRVDLNEAFRDMRENIIIQPGDIVVMQERPSEAVTRYFTQQFRLTSDWLMIAGNRFTSRLVGVQP